MLSSQSCFNRIALNTLLGRVQCNSVEALVITAHQTLIGRVERRP